MMSQCMKCQGTGLDALGSICSNCAGKGRVGRNKKGKMMSQCMKCNGTGLGAFGGNCPSCRGQKLVGSVGHGFQVTGMLVGVVFFLLLLSFVVWVVSTVH
jgi:DnaJ-class molecular chaperone